jgi:hypothetical protein
LPSTFATPDPPFDQVTPIPGGVVVAPSWIALLGDVAKIVALAGLTATAVAGGFVTSTVAVPLALPLVAVNVTVPVSLTRPAGWTNPVLDTVATPVLLEDHVTTRPVSTVPPASFSVAFSCWVWAIVIVDVPGATVTLATGSCAIVTVAAPLALPLVAVIVTVPLSFAPVGDTSATSPVLDTVAMAVLLEDHVTVRPVRTVPPASLSVAASCWVCVAVIVDVPGVTVTLVTGSCVIVTVAVPLALPLVAVIVTVPLSFGPVGDTRPVLDTVAMPVLLEDHVTVRPVSTVPPASLSVAFSCCV